MESCEFSHHELLFLRLLSLTGCISFSLFQGVKLLGGTREHSPWCSATPVAVDASCAVLQQTLGTGNPSRVNVWEWNRGEQANRLLMASCSSRLFLCSGGPSAAAADTLKPAPWSLELKWAGSLDSLRRFRPFATASCFFSPSVLLRAKRSACSASTSRSLSSTSLHVF